MKFNFFETETEIKMRLCKLLEQSNQRQNPAEKLLNFVDDFIVDSEEQDLSTQFLQMQKIDIIDLQEHFERYCNVLPVFGFKSSKYDLNLNKVFLPILVKERDIAPTVIKKANQFVSFKFRGFQFFDIEFPWWCHKSPLFSHILKD